MPKPAQPNIPKPAAAPTAPIVKPTAPPLPPATKPTLAPSSQASDIALDEPTTQEIITLTEKQLLKFISLALVIHGVYSLYNELIDVFYVYPQIPDIYKALNFSPKIYQGLVTKSILTGTTALLETAYGVFLIRRQKRLAERLHLIASIGLFIVVFLVSRLGQPLDLQNAPIPASPTIPNIIRQRSLPALLELFSRP